ncbi:MAG: hypothetical protein ICV64_02000 [Thermoleophilia bacterium]|nr:hypothetical protein [Thermoleophilia bacterium]
MDEARAVLERLRRIELLEREGATAPHLLAEVRALLVEAEAWVRAEPGGTARAEEALDDCRRALDRAPVGARA